MLDRLVRSLFEIIVAVITIMTYIACGAMLMFWCWFTDKLIRTPDANWEEIVSMITKSSESKFYTLMTVNPFVVALVCTFAIIMTIWCHALFFSKSNSSQKNTKENS